MEIPFEVEYDPAVIDPSATYTLRAVVEDATPMLLFINDTAIPVITGGAPTTDVTVEVVPAMAVSSAAASPMALESATP